MMALTEPLANVPPSRRRLVVFLLAFLPALAASLIYIYTQPPEYRSAARLEITPPAAVALATDTQNGPPVVRDPAAFLTAVQELTSRPLVEDALARLKRHGELPDLGTDPTDAAQRMLSAEPIDDTQIVRLSATGCQQRFLPLLVNAIADTYRQHVAVAYKSLATSADNDAAAEANALETKIGAQRDAVDAFRQRYDIVSIEHRENDVLANIAGLSKAYTAANERLAKARGRVDALKAGKAVVRPKDDPTLAALQQHAAALRERWRQMRERFTPAYLSLDPDAKSLRAGLDDLEEELRSQTGTGERAATIEAQQELAAAQTAVDQLRRAAADNQKQAQEFASHLNEYKALREDLDHLEALHRAALDRLAKQQASERERAPRVELIEAAMPSRQPWRPNYSLEAAVATGGSLVLAIFATWLAEFLAGPRPRAPALVQYAWMPALVTGTATSPPLSVPDAITAIPRLAAPAARLPPAATAKRELTEAEITVLLAAATEEVQFAAVALLSGLDSDELAGLTWDDVEFAAGVMRTKGERARLIRLAKPMRSLLAVRSRDHPQAGVAVMQSSDGRPLTPQTLDRMILLAAHDAGLDRPHDVTADMLRYTYISFLLRQGIRAGDLDRIIGPIPQADLVALMRLHSPQMRRPIDEIEQIHPALREIAADGTA